MIRMLSKIVCLSLLGLSANIHAAATYKIKEVVYCRADLQSGYRIATHTTLAPEESDVNIKMEVHPIGLILENVKTKLTKEYLLLPDVIENVDSIYHENSGSEEEVDRLVSMAFVAFTTRAVVEVYEVGLTHGIVIPSLKCPKLAFSSTDSIHTMLMHY